MHSVQSVLACTAFHCAGSTFVMGLTKHRVYRVFSASTAAKKLLGCANYSVDRCDLNIVNVDGSALDLAGVSALRSKIRGRRCGKYAADVVFSKTAFVTLTSLTCNIYGTSICL